MRRQLPLPNVAIDQAYRQAVSGIVRDVELTEQIAYNDTTERVIVRAARLLHDFGLGLFTVTLLTCVTYLGAELLRLDWSGAALPWVTLITVPLPMFGAAVTAIRMQGDFPALAIRAAQTKSRLKALDGALSVEPASYARLSDRIEQAAALMTADLSEWQTQFRTHPLNLPT